MIDDTMFATVILTAAIALLLGAMTSLSTRLMNYVADGSVIDRAFGPCATAQRIGRAAGKLLVWVANLLLVSTLVALVTLSVFFAPLTIRTTTMAPTLVPGDTVLVSKYAYGSSRYELPGSITLNIGVTGNPAMNDVVAFRWPETMERMPPSVGRIVGLPGMVIPFDDDEGEPEWHRDDGDQPEQWDRENLPDDTAYLGDDRLDRDGSYTVPPNYYVVMPDNLDASPDHGPDLCVIVPVNDIAGRVETILFSIEPPASSASDPLAPIAEPWTWMRWDRFLRGVASAGAGVRTEPPG